MQQKNVSAEQTEPVSTFWANPPAVQAPHFWKDLMLRLILFVKSATNIQQFNKDLEREKREKTIGLFL